MRPQYSVTISPLTEPVTLSQVADHLRVDSTDDQQYINDLIPVAREYFDSMTNRSSAETTYTLTAHCWQDLFADSGNYVIPIFRTPLVSVSSVKYYAPDAATLTTMEAAEYRVITGAEPGRVQLVNSPPSIADRIDAVQITFVAGNDCPPAMSRHGIKMIVAHFYENRLPIAFASSSEIPYTLKAIVENQKIGGNF